MHKWHAGNDRDWSEMMLMSDDVMTLCKGVKRWNGDGIDNEHIHDIKMNNDDVDDEGSFWFRKKNAQQRSHFPADNEYGCIKKWMEIGRAEWTFDENNSHIIMKLVEAIYQYANY